MRCGLFSNAVLFGQTLPRLPWQEPYYEKPASSISSGYVEFLERHSHFIYPALALLVLAVLVYGIIHSWRVEELDSLVKDELKREIVLTLRKAVGGETVEALARLIGVPPLKTARLLEEMQRDGILVSFTNTERRTVWQVKGIGSAR